jgi:hypothetical protein
MGQGVGNLIGVTSSEITIISALLWLFVRV